MKKVIVFISVLALVIICVTFAKYAEIKKFKQNVDKINKEFLLYEDRTIQINTLNTLMNKAIQYNLDNKVEQDDKKSFIENDSNSIKIYIELSVEKTTVTMERLLLNQDLSNRAEKVEYAFSTSLFRLKNVEYHKKTGQIKSLTFEEILN